MRYWNETCLLTRLPIRPGEPSVLLFIGRRNAPSGIGRADAFFAPASLPVFGNYDGRGGLSDIQEPQETARMLAACGFRAADDAYAHADTKTITPVPAGTVGGMLTVLIHASMDGLLFVDHPAGRSQSLSPAYASLVSRKSWDLMVACTRSAGPVSGTDRLMGPVRGMDGADALCRLTDYMDLCRLSYVPVHGSKNPHEVDADAHKRLLRLVAGDKGLPETDFAMVCELKEEYEPAQRGVVSDAEIRQIRDALKLGERTDVELQNIRNAAVMLYAQWSDRAIEEQDVAKTMELNDAMSGICGVIDREKAKRGMPV